MLLASFSGGNILADVRPLAAGVGGGKEHRVDMIEIALFLHAAHEHRTHHATPADQADFFHCVIHSQNLNRFNSLI
jgi:hypothetical protein